MSDSLRYPNRRLPATNKSAFFSLKRVLLLVLSVCVVITGTLAEDWPSLRGPSRDGVSKETNLVEKWSPAGENLLWRVPYGGLSAPVVVGDRVYIQNAVGEGATLQERLLCFNVNNGLLLWEQRININHSAAPVSRVGATAPTLDPQTGHLYAVTMGGLFAAFNRDGMPLWRRSLTEEFGFIGNENGRIAPPVVDRDLVIVSGITSGWGDMAANGHRFIAFDKATGETVWINSPGRQPIDMAMSPAIITEADGMRLLVAGGSDGAFYAMKVSTGQPVWRYQTARSALNSGAIQVGDDLIVTHSGPTADGSATGFMAAINPAATGEIANSQAKWVKTGFMAGESSPVTDGQRIYQIDNSGLLAAFDPANGNQLWTMKLGASQKASPVFADGKIYVGTEEGKFFILRPRADGVDVLSEATLTGENGPERIVANAAISTGRIYVATSQALYAIGRPGSRVPGFNAATAAASGAAPPVEAGEPAYLQVIPADLAMIPGEALKFRVKVFDSKGNFIRDAEPPQAEAPAAGRGGRGAPAPPQRGQAPPQRGQAPPAAQAQRGQAPPAPAAAQGQRGPRGQAAAAAAEAEAAAADAPPPPPPPPAPKFALADLTGEIAEDGTYTVPADATGFTGAVQVTVGDLSGEARVRVVPSLSSELNFDSLAPGAVPAWWVNTGGKFAVKEVGGAKVLAKLADQSPFVSRARAYAGKFAVLNYTTEADVRFTASQGSAGVVAQGYELLVSPSDQRASIRSWASEPTRNQSASLTTAPDTWYRLKLQVEMLIDGNIRARGKVWPANGAEPEAWTLERTDPLAQGILVGSPGLFADAPSEIHFDNFKLTPKN